MRAVRPALRSIGLAAACLAGATAAADSATAPVAGRRLAVDASAFGAPLRIEAIAAAKGEEALRAAVAAAQEMAGAGDPARGALATLNAAAGGGPQKVPAALLAALQRALAFCGWSQGAHGPLGGALYELWGLRTPRRSLPGDEAVERAIAEAGCDRLRIDATAGTIDLAAGARVDLWGFAAGAAVDRALEVLAERGVRDASVTLGAVQRAVGGGAGGRGWPLHASVPAVLAGFTANLELRDQAFALVSTADGALRAGSEAYAPYLDQQRGRPVAGVVATVAVTELALDAQALAATLFVTGTRRGSLLLGQLQPSPAALWVLGDGNGEPLVSDYRWGRRRR
jgi:thiamine biosynthesis lipoprotein